jgi:endonuclease I
MIKTYILSLLLSIFSISLFAQGTETFTNIPANSGTYTTNNWTGDNTLPWSATDSRTDQVITGRAITIRNGSVFCNAIPNGITNLSFNHKQFFTGSNPVLQVYINGTLIGTANPTTTQAVATFTNINVSGSFNLEIRQVTAGLRIGIDDVSWTSFGGTPCIEPANQPTILNLTPTINSVSGSFTPSTPAVDGYLVVRSLSSTLTLNPADGMTYTAGQTLGNGTIVTSGASTNFADNGLSSNTLYYYFVFAYNSISCTGAPNYLIVNPLVNSVTILALPACTTPAAPPIALVLTPGPTSISGTFTAEPTANRYLVVYSQNNTLGFTPLNGTTYTAGQVIGADKIVNYGITTSFVITGLNSLTTYYVFIFAAKGSCTGEPFYNATSLDGAATTTNSGIPPGYYDAAAGLSCGPLKTALRNIITTGHIALNYSTIDNIEIPIVDTIRSDDALQSIIWDVYSNNNTGPEPFEFNSSQTPTGGFCGGSSPGTEGVCWNKEHTFPRSWFRLSGSSYEQPTEADLFLVRPTDAKINSNRGNIPYSTTGAPTYQFPTAGIFPVYPMPPNPVLDKIGPSNYPGVTSASAFEPHNAVKGDLARAYFYILTRYQNELASWVSLNGVTSITTVVDGTTNGGLYPSFQLSYLQMMYDWNNLDPVDAKEINRNNLVYSQQNNRNPYVDHPEFVLAVWQCTGVLPVTVTGFTAQKNNESVLLKWYATFETNFKKYEIERSTDGWGFYKIGEVAGRNLANYSFTDNNLPNANTVYYRLKMIDIDGKFSNSKIVSIRIANNFFNALVYPNPTREKLVVKLQQALSEKSQLVIADLSGRIVMQQQVTGGQKNIDLSVSHLPAGRYFIKISNNSELINQSFVIIK